MHRSPTAHSPHDQLTVQMCRRRGRVLGRNRALASWPPGEDGTSTVPPKLFSTHGGSRLVRNLGRPNSGLIIRPSCFPPPISNLTSFIRTARPPLLSSDLSTITASTTTSTRHPPHLTFSPPCSTTILIYCLSACACFSFSPLRFSPRAPPLSIRPASSVTPVMPTVLLPASAAAFAPRSPPTVVLNSKVEPWLTATLKRTNRVKRPLNSVPQHVRCLTDTLSAASALWTLCSLMLPKAPESELRKDANPLVEALFNHQILHVEAYVVHVDLVMQNEVAFKLTPESIEALIDYHKDVYLVDIAANTWDWSEKAVQVKKLQEEFVQATNRFVYRTNALALEGMEEDGAGELLSGRSEEVKDAIMGLFLPLLPPPPKQVELVRPIPLLPNSPNAGTWWSQPTMPSPHPAPVDPWKVVPSTPNTTSCGDIEATLWAGIDLSDFQSPSPTPSYCQPFCTGPQYYTAPMPIAPIPQLPLPSLFAQQQCSASIGFGGFGWDRYQEYMTI